MVTGKRVSAGLEVERVAVCFRCILTYRSREGGTNVKGPVNLMMSGVSQVVTKMKQQTKQSLRT